MKSLRWFSSILAIALLLGACSSAPDGGGNPIIRLFPSATPVQRATPSVHITPAPDARVAVTGYLDALVKGDYAAMYAMLTKVSRDSLSQEDFTKTYNDALNQMSAGKLEYKILSSLLSPYKAQVGYHITYHTSLVGDVERDIVMNLVLEDGGWKVQWEPGLILPELNGGNRLAMDYQIPARGDIYDRDGKPVATQSEIFAFGIDTGAIDYNNINTLTGELSRLCGRPVEDIENQIAASGPGWYLAMCEGTRDEAEHLLAVNPGGLAVTSYTSRYYANQGAASPVTGYVLSIDPSQVDEYRRLGYRGDERVGQQGIEKWAEQYLAGKHGGSLYVADPNGQIVTRLGQSDPQAADSVYLTIDNNMQYWAEQALRPFRGAIVVLERDSGRVLAMASSPSYDANLFDPNSPNRDLLVQLMNDPNQPLVNRAAQGQYPLGSVFKIITFSAALESGLYEAATTYDCQYDFTELVPFGGPVLHDWTWQHCQDALAAGKTCDGRSQLPSGLLTLPEGLMRSCNPYFWHIGLDLFKNNRGGDIAKMANGFGLGEPTGIAQIAEASGNIAPATEEIDATNQAIGQGTVEVTPLQVADFIAAVGNGGTLYRPQLVEKITALDGSTVTAFKPEARGTLPLRPDNLQLLQEALKSVVRDPRGTANFRLRGLSIPVAGKTGTAENSVGKSHAWFAGYTMDAAATNQPDIAIAVLIENIGEGSDYAAPLFKAMVETYYFGAPQSFPWFGPVGGPLYTPTPFGGIPTKTPKP